MTGMSFLKNKFILVLFGNHFC